jgi:hypothetical protein
MFVDRPEARRQWAAASRDMRAHAIHTFAARVARRSSMERLELAALRVQRSAQVRMECWPPALPC